MDPVEQAASKALNSNIYIDIASSSWRHLFKVDPAYVEVLSVEAGISKDKIVVECDGIRIWAWRQFLRTTAKWRIAESVGKRKKKAPPFDTNQYCELDAVSIAPYLDLRRQRLQQRGLYQAADVIDIRRESQHKQLPA